uniref:RING-type domain-containing protein n=1 Tax=Setaria digitata TaxID=48799 RepID=A0A915Q8B5_9BILA
MTTLRKIECFICFLDIPVSEISALHCGHIFHQSCIIEWLSNRIQCPVCREKVGRQGHFKLHFEVARSETHIDGDDRRLTELYDTLRHCLMHPPGPAELNTSYLSHGNQLTTLVNQIRVMQLRTECEVLRCHVCSRRLYFNDIAALHCGHTFHLACISRYVSHSPKCPVCGRKTHLEAIVSRLFINIQEESEHYQFISSDGATLMTQGLIAF